MKNIYFWVLSTMSALPFAHAEIHGIQNDVQVYANCSATEGIFSTTIGCGSNSFDTWGINNGPDYGAAVPNSPNSSSSFEVYLNTNFQRVVAANIIEAEQMEGLIDSTARLAIDDAIAACQGHYDRLFRKYYSNERTSRAKADRLAKVELAKIPCDHKYKTALIISNRPCRLEPTQPYTSKLIPFAPRYSYDSKYTRELAEGSDTNYDCSDGRVP